MSNEERNERYKRVRDYAMGNQDIAKFKSLMLQNRNPPSGTYISIDWRIPKRILRKIKSKFFKKIKPYKMVARLMKAA
jgi:hypothetical protein